MDITRSIDFQTVSQHPIARSFFTDFDVYRGQLRNQTVIALKVIKVHSSLLKEVLSRLQRRRQEVLGIWAQFSHPNIVRLVGKAQFRRKEAVVYEWHEYGSIRQYLEHFPMTDRYELSSQICEGVTYLHTNGIIHGNLKGDQVLFSHDGIPRILLSIITSTRTRDAVVDVIQIRWAAPELFQGSPRLTFASDVYALGMTILEAIAENIPYNSNLNPAYVHQWINRGEPSIRFTDDIPKNEAENLTWDTLRKCWSLDPANRPSAGHARNTMQMIYQTSDGLALKVLKVTPETTVQDLVTHYEQRRLTNFTGLLQQIGISTAIPLVDGALANVYKVQLPDHRCVAVKCVKHKTPHKKIKRAARELSCWSSYKHEYILPVFGFAVVKGDFAMVSPWMENGNITDYVVIKPDCDHLLLCTQLAEAIAYLHEQNVVHGDIKGPNVLISDTGKVQVTDFGVSIADHQEIEFSATTGGGGTYRWQAPEILLGPSNSSSGHNPSDGDSSKEGDVYALGMTFVEIYTGERPYGSMNWSGRMSHNIILGQLRPPRPLLIPADSTGNELWKLMELSWAGRTEERPTAGEVYERLRDLSKRNEGTL